MKVKQLVKAKELCEKLNITSRTLTRWNTVGKVTCYKIPGKKICYYDAGEVQKAE